MKNSKKVFLFDVDGVIVDPLAYKEGIKQSLSSLCELAGIPNSKDLVLKDDEIALMESVGIHDVWDITNIAFASILAGLAKTLHQKVLSPAELARFADESAYTSKAAAYVSDKSASPTAATCSPNDSVCYSNESDASLKGSTEFSPDLALEELAKFSCAVERPNYVDLSNLYARLGENAHPPDFLGKIIFESLPKNDSTDFFVRLIKAFTTYTRSPYKSLGTRLFQNIILGDEFAATYGLNSVYEGPSLLKRVDRVLMTPKTSAKLEALEKSAASYIAIYTARPSHPPSDVSNIIGYSPEAEIAASLAGLEAFPLVGMGSMEWLAAQHGERSEALTKPNFTHSLSAFLAAVLQKSSSEVMELAYSITKKNELERLEQFVPPGHYRIFVFEDTISGIKPMQELASTLKDSKIKLEVVALGIAKTENKQNALKPFCKEIFADVNKALDFALQLD